MTRQATEAGHACTTRTKSPSGAGCQVATGTYSLRESALTNVAKDSRPYSVASGKASIPGHRTPAPSPPLPADCETLASSPDHAVSGVVRHTIPLFWHCTPPPAGTQYLPSNRES